MDRLIRALMDPHALKARRSAVGPRLCTATRSALTAIERRVEDLAELRAQLEAEFGDV